MRKSIKRLLKKLLGLVGWRRTPWDGTHQGSFKRNKERIFAGDIPERYKELSSLIPGNRILDVGSADGTLALHLSATREHVYGVEQSLPRYQTATALQKTWSDRTGGYRNCTFLNASLLDKPELFEDVDTVTFIRVIYHLGEHADGIMRKIREKQNIRNVVLCGNRSKEMRLQNGENFKQLGDYARLATEEGMVHLLKHYGFWVDPPIRLESTGDCLVIGHRPY